MKLTFLGHCNDTCATKVRCWPEREGQGDAFRASAQPWKHRAAAKGGKSYVEKCAMEVKFHLKYLVNIVN